MATEHDEMMTAMDSLGASIERGTPLKVFETEDGGFINLASGWTTIGKISPEYAQIQKLDPSCGIISWTEGGDSEQFMRLSPSDYTRLKTFLRGEAKQLGTALPEANSQEAI